MYNYILSVFFILISIFCFWGAYEAIKYQRTYWFAPNISGYKRRKVEKTSKGFSYFAGISAIIFGALFLLLGIKIIIISYLS